MPRKTTDAARRLQRRDIDDLLSGARQPETYWDRAALVREALRYRTARQLARLFGPLYTSEHVKHWAKAGDYYDFRIPYFRNAIKAARVRGLA